MGSEWSYILWTMAVLTMTVGNVLAIAQTSVKRMLAYSSIAHAGYLLIGVIAGGEVGGSALLFYLLAYTLMSLGAFGVVMVLKEGENDNDQYAHFAGLGFRRPFLGMTMSIFMLSLAGFPPLGGFIGKFYLFRSAIETDEQISCVKRMLAYSSIAHAGYLLIGVIAGGEVGGSALLFYLLAYTLMSLGAFGVVMVLKEGENDNDQYAHFAGLGFRRPFLGMTMSIFMLSLAGFPPLGGFIGKFYLFRSAIETDHTPLAIIGVLNSLLSVITPWEASGPTSFGPWQF